MSPIDRTDTMLSVESEMTRVLRGVRAAIQQNAERFSPELQPSGYLVLGFLAKRHPVPPGEIIAQMGMDKSAVSRQLRILKDLGFVTSVPDPEDRRASLFAPTPETLARLAEIRDETHTVYAEVFGDWSDDDLVQFARLLGRLQRQDRATMTTLHGMHLDEAAAKPGLRERKKEETRTAIHEAALRLVADNGVAAASVDAICSEAGVSTRTFFNYFPSKVSAILGLSSFRVTDAQRAAFLQGEGERALVRDLCTLVGGIMDETSREGVERAAIRDLLARRPEVAPDIIKFAAELRADVVELAEQRTTPVRAQLAVTLVMSGVDCALHRPLETDIDKEFTDWLFETVTAMQAIGRDSID